ncbi:MAG: helix-turn-helix domain-containing protein [Bosea sp. (in: a-proteobacteria)]
MPRPLKSDKPRPKPHSPVSVQKPRPPRKQGPVTIDDVELLVSWLLETHRYTPWFDTEAAAAYLRREPGTLKGWRSKGEGPRFYLVNEQFIRYHIDDLDAFVRGGRRRVPKWLRDKAVAVNPLPLSGPRTESDEK